MSAALSVITCTTGEAGSGKTYVRCARFLVDKFLKDSDGVHWSNFPLGEVPPDHPVPPSYAGETFVDRIARAAAKLHGIDELLARGRVRMIPADVLGEWERGESGPWDYFDGQDLNGAHVAIDEVHNYCDVQGHPEHRKRWRQWLGEIRHRGCTIEFISQNLAKIPLEIRREAGLHIAVTNMETERDPFFRIALQDWYELRAGFVTGKYRSAVVERERRSAMGHPGNWTERRTWPFDPYYFRFYDSFSAPQKGGVKGRVQKRQFERRSKLGLLGWFVLSNAGRLSMRGAFALAVLWFCFGRYVGLGGGQWLARSALARVQGAVASQSKPRQVAPSSVAAGVVSAISSSVEPSSETVPPGAASMPARVELTAAQKLGAITQAAISAAELAREETVAERERADDLQLEVDRLRAELAAQAEVLAVGRGYAVLRDGQEYRVGERIEGGLYAGRKVQSVNWRRRVVVLDDGTSLGMPRRTRDDGGGGLRGFLPGLVVGESANVR